jgi:ATPase subunit of ABC transporter with duplicated ATPase domains
MLILKDVTYKLPDGEILFKNLSFSIKDNEKVALVGKNGIGKSTIFKLIARELVPYSGKVDVGCLNISYFPQKFNELNYTTVADVFGLEDKVKTLNAIENGTADVSDYETLDNNWNCKEFIDKKLSFFNLKFDYLFNYNFLSGGEKVKLILTKILNKGSDFLLLDEPTNNMDYESKRYFYDFIKAWTGGIFVISHDRELLNLVEKTFELRRVGMKNTELFVYGGNYDFWAQQKMCEEKAIENSYEHSIRVEQDKKIQAERTLERFRKGYAKSGRLDKYGNLKAARTLQEMNREKSALKQVVNSKNKISNATQNIEDIQDKREIKQNIYFKFQKQDKIVGKKLIEIENLCFSYTNNVIFKNFNLIINAGDRVVINGKNGSGKTTLLKIIIGKVSEYSGIVNIKVNRDRIGYLEQEQRIFNDTKTILDSMKAYTGLNENDCRDILAKFLFRTDAVYKLIGDISGGEKIRMVLACILAKNNVELLIIDEPTNNLDLESIQILEDILNQFNGTIIVVSHDKHFVENIGATCITL